jgi:small-conductance mechanosensitive channel
MSSGPALPHRPILEMDMNLPGTGELQASGLSTLTRWLTEPLFTIGNASFSASGLIKLFVFLALLGLVTHFLRRALLRRVFPKARIDPGTAYAIGNLVSYLFITIGLLVGLQASGIDLSALTVLFGAVGVGVGFGIQTIMSNFISGLIILFEQPIRVGDHIQVGDLDGKVIRIRARATEIQTNSEISVIVPNSEFITQRVINWSLGSDRIRMSIPVRVAYGSDVEKVREALLEAATSVEVVLDQPPPTVRLTAFADSGIDFELLAWTREMLQRPRAFRSRMNFAIHASLKRHNIAIPLPQREIHFRGAVPASFAGQAGDSHSSLQSDSSPLDQP